MYQEFILDLRCTRRKAGLTQDDCGYLLGSNRHVIKQLETGARLPTLSELCTLTLIFGRNFESLFSALFASIRHSLRDRLAELPKTKIKSARSYNRQNTLNALVERLSEETGAHYGA